MNNRKQYESPQGYDLLHPEKKLLPDRLLEISGIAFIPGSRDTLCAINDEEGKVYTIPLPEGKITSFKFARGGDYEDVAILREWIFVLESKGLIHFFPFPPEGHKVDHKKVDVALPKGDYESMYVDQKDSLLMLLRKSSPKHEAHFISGYSFSIQHDTTFVPLNSFSIPLDQLNMQLPKGFQPSCFARHPLTHEWFIISATHRLLMVTDEAWNFKNVYHLSPSVFHQPEGIAFDEQGNLYISNEGDELSHGNVLIFRKG
jgi:hypothetical protein